MIGKPPTAEGYFIHRRIFPKELARKSITELMPLYPRSITSEDFDWFVEHADERLRWMHSNNPKWRDALESDEDWAYDFIVSFVEYWVNSFLSNPKFYKECHSKGDLCLKNNHPEQKD